MYDIHITCDVYMYVYVCMYMYDVCVVCACHDVCGDQRTMFRNCVSPSTVGSRDQTCHQALHKLFDSLFECLGPS